MLMTILRRDAIFSSDGLSKNLTQKSLKGGISTMLSQAIRLVLSTAGTVVLARLLTPGEYGLVGMAMVVVAFARMFVTAGLSMATVQKKEISHEQINALFWINLFIGIFLCFIVFISSFVS